MLFPWCFMKQYQNKPVELDKLDESIAKPLEFKRWLVNKSTWKWFTQKSAPEAWNILEHIIVYQNTAWLNGLICLIRPWTQLGFKLLFPNALQPSYMACECLWRLGSGCCRLDDMTLVIALEAVNRTWTAWRACASSSWSVARRWLNLTFWNLGTARLFQQEHNRTTVPENARNLKLCVGSCMKATYKHLGNALCIDSPSDFLVWYRRLEVVKIYQNLARQLKSSSRSTTSRLLLHLYGMQDVFIVFILALFKKIPSNATKNAAWRCFHQPAANSAHACFLSRYDIWDFIRPDPARDPKLRLRLHGPIA